MEEQNKLDRTQMVAIADELHMESYPKFNKLIVGLDLEKIHNLNLRYVFNKSEVLTDFLTTEFGIDLRVNHSNTLLLSVQYGDNRCDLNTEYGVISVEIERLSEYLATPHGIVESSLYIQDERLKNLSLNLLYISEYSQLDEDSWRSILLQDDYLVLVLDASHALYAEEKSFIRTIVQPIFSPQRLSFGLYNVEHAKSSEWIDITQIVNLKLEAQYRVFPIFSKEVSLKVRERYAYYEDSLISLLMEAKAQALELRTLHHSEVLAYEQMLFKQELLSMLGSLEKKQALNKESFQHFQVNQETIEKSRKNIENNISLFLESPSTAIFRTSIQDFSKVLNTSLIADINASENIKQDAKALTRYLTYVWEEFLADQNQILNESFRKQVASLFLMMKLDMDKMVEGLSNEDIQGKIQNKIEEYYNVNSFFSRKTSGSNGLTDMLTIGGLILGICGIPVGWGAMLASELIKMVGHRSMDEELKKELTVKIPAIIEKNTLEIQKQSEHRFKEVSEMFKTEILICYDELLDSTKVLMETEGKNIEKAQQTIEYINKVLVKLI